MLQWFIVRTTWEEQIFSFFLCLWKLCLCSCHCCPHYSYVYVYVASENQPLRKNQSWIPDCFLYHVREGLVENRVHLSSELNCAFQLRIHNLLISLFERWTFFPVSSTPRIQIVNLFTNKRPYFDKKDVFSNERSVRNSSSKSVKFSLKDWCQPRRWRVFISFFDLMN